jgi:hypothetical protein
MLGSGMLRIVHFRVWTITCHPGTWHHFKVCVRATVKLRLKVTVDLVVHHLSDNRTARGQVALVKQLSRLNRMELQALLLCCSNEWDRLEDVISDLSCPTLGFHQRRLKPVGDIFGTGESYEVTNLNWFWKLHTMYQSPKHVGNYQIKPFCLIIKLQNGYFAACRRSRN